ncbi:hypothetical protein [Rhizobium sp. LEGMi135b]
MFEAGVVAFLDEKLPPDWFDRMHGALMQLTPLPPTFSSCKNCPHLVVELCDGNTTRWEDLSTRVSAVGQQARKIAEIDALQHVQAVRGFWHEQPIDIAYTF